MNSAEGKPDPRLEDHLMTPAEVAAILPDIDGFIGWANSLKEYALKMARDEKTPIPGYKLVRGRSNRSWKGDRDVKALLVGAGVSETDLLTEPTLKTPTQVEKALGVKPFAVLASDLDLVEKPLGTPALVPDTDSRPAIDAAKEAAAAFGVATDQ